MSRFYRFMLNFGIVFALACFFLTSPAYSLSTSDTQIAEGELFKLGIEKMQHGSYPEAIQDFTEVIKLKNDFSSAYSNRCLAYLQLGDYQNAIVDCNQALKFTPNNVEAHLNRGLAYGLVFSQSPVCTRALSESLGKMDSTKKVYQAS
ncbi:tetratricopeptide repeat protein, partial [Nostoc sp.]|uniref:tetratricopeptide repeat protein n=1 Tax=Nostoc sp. TaxID=1180 RepID=UPI002FF5045C